MLRRAVVALVLIGCTPERPGPTWDPDTGLPVGVWQPDPEAIGGAELVADAGTIWFAYPRLCEPTPCDGIATWLVHTEANGEQLHAPVRVDTSEPASAASVAVTDDAVLVALKRYGSGVSPAAVRVFDREARPLEPAERALELRFGDQALAIRSFGIFASGGDRARLVADPYTNTGPAFPGAIAVADVDARGNVLGAVTPVGTADEGTSPNLTATTLGDGSTLVAWDHHYDGCTGDRRPAFAQTVPVSNAGIVGTPLTVHDLPERNETDPALASVGSATFVAWQSDWHNGIALARYPDLDHVVQFGAPGTYHVSPSLALADENHGAIVWLDLTGNGNVSVAPFAFENGQLRTGTTRVLPYISEGSRYPVGIVHVENDTYVVAWSEGPENRRVYATQIDVGEATLTVPPPSVAAPTSAPPPRLGGRRCTH